MRMQSAVAGFMLHIVGKAEVSGNRCIGTTLDQRDSIRLVEVCRTKRGVDSFLPAQAHDHRRATRMLMRAALGFECHNEVLSGNAFRQWRIHDGCAAPSIRLE